MLRVVCHERAVELCGGDPNTESFRQKVAAVLPVKNDHHKIVLKLISLGADVNMPDFAGLSSYVLQQITAVRTSSRLPRCC